MRNLLNDYMWLLEPSQLEKATHFYDKLLGSLEMVSISYESWYKGYSCKSNLYASEIYSLQKTFYGKPRILVNVSMIVFAAKPKSFLKLCHYLVMQFVVSNEGTPGGWLENLGKVIML